MHKAVILLARAEDTSEAQAKAEEFLDGYQGQVWDWYVIGGRWSRTLNPLHKEFSKLARNLIENKKSDKEKKEGMNMIFDSDLKTHKESLQTLWSEMGGQGINPWATDQYNSNGNKDDIMPLAKCLTVAKEWTQDPEKAGNEELKHGQEWKKKGDLNMYGYNLRIAGNLFQQHFCFDCNVYNIDEWDYSIPEDPIGWYAVLIDMHN